MKAVSEGYKHFKAVVITGLVFERVILENKYLYKLEFSAIWRTICILVVTVGAYSLNLATWKFF